MSKRKGLTGEGLSESPPQGSSDGEVEIWLLSNGSAFMMGGVEYRKVASDPEGETSYVDVASIQYTTPHATRVTLIRGSG